MASLAKVARRGATGYFPSVVVCSGTGRRSGPVPGGPVRAAAELIGRLVLDEFFALGVPAQTAAQLVANVAELADLGAAGADFHVGDGPAARTHAVQPVLLVAA